MKLRQAFFLIVLVLLGGTLCRGQTSFVTGNLTAVGAACSTLPSNTNHVTINTTNLGGATFTASGTFVATLGFYASGDAGTTWQPLNVTPSNGTAAVTTATAAGLWQANVSAYTHVCILALAYTSGTAVVRIHVATVSARAGGGGGGGGISIPPGSVPGQGLGVGPSGVVAVSPGLLDSTASPIGGTYTPVCTTSTNTGDRGRVMVATTAANVTIPASGAAGCANSIFYFLAQAAIQFTASPGDTFDIYNGNPPPTIGATTLSVAAGQYVTVNNGSGTNWHFLAEGPAGGGALPLSNLTAATAPLTIANAANTQTWNWTDTNNGPSFAIGETAPSTGGVLTAPVNGQAILQASTVAGSTATPLSVVQASTTTTNTTAIPALQVQSTWNNAGVVQEGIVESVTNTASASGSKLLDLYNGGTSQFSVDPVGAVTSGPIAVTGGITTTNGVSANTGGSSGLIAGFNFRSGGGQPGNIGSYQSNGTQTAAIFTGGIENSTLNGALGAGFFQGADNSQGNTGPLAAGGLAVLRGGFIPAANVQATASSGQTEVAFGYRLGTIAAAEDVVCGTTTQYQVSDCATTPQVNVIGIATNNTGMISVVAYGTVPVRLSAAMTAIGDTVCLSTTTAGQAVDSGGQGNCTTAGAQIGVIIANTGNVIVASGTSTATVALSTTMPLIQIRMR